MIYLAGSLADWHLLVLVLGALLANSNLLHEVFYSSYGKNLDFVASASSSSVRARTRNSSLFEYALSQIHFAATNIQSSPSTYSLSTAHTSIMTKPGTTTSVK